MRGGSRVQSVAIEIASEFLAWFLDKEQPGRFQSIEQVFVPWGSADELPEMRAPLIRPWLRPGDPESRNTPPRLLHGQGADRWDARNRGFSGDVLGATC